MRTNLPVLLVLCLTAVNLGAVSVTPIFNDHMVIQRDRPIKVFGSADIDEEVSVQFASHQAKAIANKSGNH